MKENQNESMSEEVNDVNDVNDGHMCVYVFNVFIMSYVFI